MVICFPLLSDVSFCCIFDYVLELFPFFLCPCCYVYNALSLFFDLLSISFLVLYILCKLSSVELLLTCIKHPLMIHSCPCQFYSGYDKSVIRGCFCPSVRTCIDEDLLVLLIQDNVINVIVYPDSLLCYRVSSSLQPGCNVLWMVLEAAVCDEFTFFFTEFHQVDTTLISSASWPLPNTAFGLSSSSYFAVEILCQHSNGWWYFIKFLTQL